MDDAKIREILALQPTIRDVEDASSADIFGPGKAFKGVAGEIVAIVSADEQEETRRS